MPSSRVCHYGDGLFETMRLRRGRIPLWPWHVRRLYLGCQRLGFEIGNSQIQFQNQLEKLLYSEAYSLDHNCDYRLRLDISRQGGGHYRPETDTYAIRLAANPLESNVWGFPSGLEVWIDDHTPTPGYHLLSPFKSVSAAVYVAAARMNSLKGFQHSILTTSSGALVEGITTNLMVLVGETWYVPSITLGGIFGVFRAWAVRQLHHWGFNVNFCFREKIEYVQIKAALLGNALYGAGSVSNIYTSNGTITLQPHPIVDWLNSALDQV